jgi:hypothetical protein
MLQVLQSLVGQVQRIGQAVGEFPRAGPGLEPVPLLPQPCRRGHVRSAGPGQPALAAKECTDSPLLISPVTTSNGGLPSFVFSIGLVQRQNTEACGGGSSAQDPGGHIKSIPSPRVTDSLVRRCPAGRPRPTKGVICGWSLPSAATCCAPMVGERGTPTRIEGKDQCVEYCFRSLYWPS